MTEVRRVEAFGASVGSVVEKRDDGPNVWKFDIGDVTYTAVVSGKTITLVKLGKLWIIVEKCSDDDPPVGSISTTFQLESFGWTGPIEIKVSLLAPHGPYNPVTFSFTCECNENEPASQSVPLDIKCFKDFVGITQPAFPLETFSLC